MSARIPIQPAQRQRLSIRCECGSHCGQTLAHYEIVKCNCGNCYWALQPRRNGPLKLFPWPGDSRRLIPASE